MGIAANEKAHFFDEGYRDGLQGRTRDIKGEGKAYYEAGNKKGLRERREADGVPIAKTYVAANENWKDVRPDYDEIRVLAERNSYKQEIEHNKILKVEMEETRQALNDEAIKIIDAMGLAMDSKNETIQKLRDYKNTVVREVSEVTHVMSRLKELMADKALKEQATQLKEFLTLCEKFAQLRSSGFFSDMEKVASHLHNG